jgi:flagellar biosynthesis protein
MDKKAPDRDEKQVDFNDNASDKTEKSNLTPSNTKKIPKNKVAVALKDNLNERKVPTISAAGRGVLAEKILELAFENDIKVRTDSDLVEILAALELDSPIPSEAFVAVAEVLSYVYRANGKPDPFQTVLED